MDDKLFYEYVLSLLFEAGHVITPFPIYRNHTSNEALYIDSKEDVVLNRFDRGLLSGRVKNFSHFSSQPLL